MSYGSTADSAKDDDLAPLLISHDDASLTTQKTQSFPKWTLAVLLTFLALVGVFLVASNASSSFKLKSASLLESTAPTSADTVLAAADYDGGDYYMTLLVPTGSASSDYDVVGQMNTPLNMRVEFLDSNTSTVLDYTDIYSVKYTLEDKQYDAKLEDMSVTLDMPASEGEYTGKINLYAQSDTNATPTSLFESDFTVKAVKEMPTTSMGTSFFKKGPSRSSSWTGYLKTDPK